MFHSLESESIFVSATTSPLLNHRFLTGPALVFSLNGSPCDFSDLTHDSTPGLNVGFYITAQKCNLATLPVNIR